MLRQLLVGFTVSICNIVIHALVMAAVVQVVQFVSSRHNLSRWWHLAAVMAVTVSVLMAAHSSEVALWSLAYAIIGVAPAGADPVYFAFVNFTTLGYGDIIAVDRWRLIGPITAMNGVLVFGWSTAVIFEVLRRTMMPIHRVFAGNRTASSKRVPERRRAASAAPKFEDPISRAQNVSEYRTP